MNTKLTLTLSSLSLCLMTGAQTMFLAGEQLVATGCLYANPTWHDVDGDGLNELVVGVKREYKKPDGTRDHFEGQVLVLKNQGTADKPSFTLENLDAAERLGVNGKALIHRQDESVENYTGCWGMQVAFGDVDGDGNEDLVQGGLFGEVTIFRGTNTPGTYEEAEFFASTNAPLRHVKRSHVGLWDVDGDGRDELVVGYMNSFTDDISTNAASMATYKYVNGKLTGGATLKDLAGTVLTVPNENYESFPVPSYTSRTGPTFADIDGDGLADLITGTSPGGIFYFPAESTNTMGLSSSWQATAVNLIPDGSLGQLGDSNPPRSRVYATDVTGDGIVDLLVGYANGTVYLYRGTNTRGFLLPCDAYTNLVAGVKYETDFGEIVGVENASSVRAKNLPSGFSLKKNSKANRYYVTGTCKTVQTKLAVFEVLDKRSKVLATTEVPFEVRAPKVSMTMDDMYVLEPDVTTNIPVTASAECTYKVTTSALPSGLRLVSSNGNYSLSGKPTKPGETVVTLKATYVTNEKDGQSVTTRILVDNRKTGRIPLKPHYDNLIAGVPVSDFTIPEAVDCTVQLPSGLGLAFDKKTGTFTGTPKKPGKYLVTFTLKVKEPSATTSKLITNTYVATTLFVVYQGLGDHSEDHGVIAPAIAIALPELDTESDHQCTVGVKFETPLEVSGGLPGVADKVKVTGLPSGISYKNGIISGVATRACTNTVTISASNSFGWTSETLTLKFVAKALPTWAYGTYNGSVSNDATNGTFTATISTTGKVSGKILVNGKTYSLSASSYVATGSKSYLFQQTLTVNKQKLPVSFKIVEDQYVDASLTRDNVSRTVGKVIAAAESDYAFDGVQSLWKRPDSKLYVPPTFVSGLKKELKVARGELVLAFGNAGTVTISGKIDGKRVSASTALLLDNFDVAQCGCFEYGYNGHLFINIPAVNYFTMVEVTLSPGAEPKTKDDVNLDCLDICYL